MPHPFGRKEWGIVHKHIHSPPLLPPGRGMFLLLSQ